MNWADRFIAADWGTTNRRAYLLSASGGLEDEFEDEKGILSVPAGGFPEAVAELRRRLGDHPMILAGMIGSNRGWREAPYAAAPVGLADLADKLIWAEAGRTAIVPGVSFCDDDAADVMRGEETQIIGAVADGLVPPNCLLCHPGTHNKWVRLSQGRIEAFRTVMTGELFNLLKKQSILADLLAEPAKPDDAFEAGVRHGLDHDDVTAELFSVRARVLLGRAPRDEAASYISGLLIGTDLRIGTRLADAEQIIVMGRPELTSLFAAAARIAGRQPSEVDGEEAFLAGVRTLVEQIR